MHKTQFFKNRSTSNTYFRMGLIIGESGNWESCLAGTYNGANETKFNLALFMPGVLKFASMPPRVLRLDVGGIQHCWQVRSKSGPKSSFYELGHASIQHSINIAPTWRSLVLMKVLL